MKMLNNRTDKGFFAIHDKTTQCPYCKTIGEFTQSINKVNLGKKIKIVFGIKCLKCGCNFNINKEKENE